MKIEVTGDQQKEDKKTHNKEVELIKVKLKPLLRDMVVKHIVKLPLTGELDGALSIFIQ